jgi:drug/metabolite transporter (DMT)-like permease
LTAYDWARLLGLAAIWSLQFLFLRISVPDLGVGVVAEGRAVCAVLVLVPAAMLAGQQIRLLANWRDYLRLSVINNVLPFGLFAYAATVLPAGYLAIINGLVPLLTVLFATLLLREPLGARPAIGLALGILGVGLIVNLGPVQLDSRTMLGVAAGLLGAAAWGLATVMIKQRTGQMPPIALAAGMISFAALLLAPLWSGVPQAVWRLESVAALIALGSVSTGLGYLAFFTLIRDIGPSRTGTVGFLIPALGVLWGWLFLDEPVTLSMLTGGALVIAAMALVLRR